jgi:hypothetical protein
MSFISCDLVKRHQQERLKSSSPAPGIIIAHYPFASLANQAIHQNNRLFNEKLELL